MESNSDKAMRAKLTGVEMPFDPAAWQQMEAMLNKEEKKRGLFWWWFGAGMASLLLLTGAGAYMAMHKGSTHKELLAQQVGGSGSVGNKQLNQVGNKEGAAGSMQQEAVGNKNGAVSYDNTEDKALISSKQINTVGNNKGEVAKANKTHGKGDKRAVSANNRTTEQQLSANSGAASNNTQLPSGNSKKGAKLSSARNPQPVTSNSTTFGNGQASTSNSNATGSPLLTDFNGKPIANTAATNAAATKPETIAADKYWMTYLNPAPTNSDMFRSEESTNLPKVKAKVFQYSIGILAHGGSTIVNGGPKGTDTSYVASLNTGRNLRIGFTHDFMFAKRFAISNSILYSQSTFTVNNVRSQTFGPAPISFTCYIQELAIPIGIKVYPVSTPKVRFYLSAGIVNHIKLKETFSYKAVAKSDSGIASTPNITNNYPYETSFDGAGTGSVETSDGYGLGSANTNTVVTVNSNEFSINNAKRYYASFYAGAGIEGIIKNKWILFAEPTFSMDLHKIGIQERRKYTVGANLGLRYQF